MTQAKIDLIAKLLAKAESTTPEEAVALTEHAERLMVKYAIDQAVIDERRSLLGQTSEPIVQKIIIFEGTYAACLLDLGAAIVYGVGTIRPLQSIRGTRRALYLVGYESDVDQALVLINSLQVQGMIAMKAWWDAHKYLYQYDGEAVKRQGRTQFVRAFGIGAGARIGENRRAIIVESGSGTELVLVSRKSKVDEHVDGMNLRKGGKAGTTKSRRDNFARTSGNIAGRAASTGERQMTQGRGLPAGAR